MITTRAPDGANKDPHWYYDHDQNHNYHVNHWSPECVAVDDINVARLASANKNDENLIKSVLQLSIIYEYSEQMLLWWFGWSPAKSIDSSTEGFVGSNVHNNPGILAVNRHWNDNGEHYHYHCHPAHHHSKCQHCHSWHHQARRQCRSSWSRRRQSCSLYHLYGERKSRLSHFSKDWCNFHFTKVIALWLPIFICYNLVSAILQ